MIILKYREGKILNKTFKNVIIGILSTACVFGMMFATSAKEVKATPYAFYRITSYAFSTGTDVNLGYRTKAIDSNNTGFYESSSSGNVDYTWRLYLPNKSTQAMGYVNGVGETPTQGTLYTAYRAKGNAFCYKAASSHTGNPLTLTGSFTTAP